jgi:excisionase family DNA binding protein
MLSVHDAAKELGISPSLVYKLCASGKIRHERHGMGRGTIRIPREALDDYRRAAQVLPAPRHTDGLKHISLPSPSGQPLAFGQPSGPDGSSCG